VEKVLSSLEGSSVLEPHLAQGIAAAAGVELTPEAATEAVVREGAIAAAP
jgi:hypothetical protein